MPSDSRLTRCTLRSERVVLRAPVPRDMDDRLACTHSAEFNRMHGISGTDPLTAEEVETWYDRMTRDPLRWMVEFKGRCIGSAQLHRLSEQNRSSRYAIALFDTSVWNIGIGTEVTKLIQWYAFTSLDLHRIDLRVLDSNRRAIRTYEKCGFQHEGILRDSARIEDGWDSDILMGILEHDYRVASATWTEIIHFRTVSS